MATKPNAKDCIIKEQIIEDAVTGLTLQFVKYDGKNRGCRLTIFGENLPFGNRDIFFDSNGEDAGSGTHVGECPKPTFIKEQVGGLG